LVRDGIEGSHLSEKVSEAVWIAVVGENDSHVSRVRASWEIPKLDCVLEPLEECLPGEFKQICTRGLPLFVNKHMDESNVGGLGQFLEIGPKYAQAMTSRDTVHFVQWSMNKRSGVDLISLAKAIDPFHPPSKRHEAIKSGLPGSFVNHHSREDVEP